MMTQKRKYYYAYRKLALSIYQRGLKHFYVRVSNGKNGYLHVKLPATTADAAIKYGSEFLEKFRSRKEQEAIAKFRRASVTVN